MGFAHPAQEIWYNEVSAWGAMCACGRVAAALPVWQQPRRSSHHPTGSTRPGWLPHARSAAARMLCVQDQTSYTTCDPNNGEDPTCSDSLPLDIDVLDHLSYMLLDIALMCGIAK